MVAYIMPYVAQKIYTFKNIQVKNIASVFYLKENNVVEYFTQFQGFRELIH